MTAASEPEQRYRFAWRNPSGVEHRSAWTGTRKEAQAWRDYFDRPGMPHWVEPADQPTIPLDTAT